MYKENSDILVKINTKPISLQSSGKKVNKFRQAVIEALDEYNYVFTNELNIEITWYTLEQYKIFRSDSYDIDNIIKPLLDSLVSSGKILIDDSQVSSISCSFIDSVEEYLEVRIIPRLFDLKIYIDDLVFVEFYKGYLFPVSKKYYNERIWKEIYFPKLNEYVRLSSIAYDLFNLKIVENEESYIKIERIKLKEIGLNTVEELYDSLNEIKMNTPSIGKIYPKNKINEKIFNIINIE